MSTPDEQITETPQASAIPTKPKPRRRWLAPLLLAIVAVVAYFLVGFYTIPPIGALPSGATVVIWRSSARPFFDSPDKLCLDTQGGVSLLCRGLAIGALNTDAIILRLPYQDWAYLISTGGKTFSR